MPKLVFRCSLTLLAGLTVLLNGAVQRAEIAVFDALGNRVWMQRVNGQSQVDLPQLAAGAYLVLVQGEGFSSTERLIVTK